MSKDFPTKKIGQRIKVRTKMDKNGFGGVEKMCQFCNDKIQHHENPYQHLVFRVVDNLNLNITTH